MELVFQTQYGHYEFLVMSFGLTNASMEFIYLINMVLKEYLCVILIVFINDLLIYSKSEDEHVEHSRIVLEILKDLNCMLCFASVSFCLGILLSFSI